MGAFPRRHEAIRALPGIGDYTAAAIASIAFGLPHAVIDGNVMRVVARVENDAADIGSARTRERFGAVAQGWLDAAAPGHFNQALMELGATVCLPRNPLCLVCPLAACCHGREEGTAAQLPVKLRRTVPIDLERTLLVIRRDGKLLLRQNGEQGRLAGFWDLPTPQELPAARVGERLGEFPHTITHHRYTIAVHAATVRRVGPGFGWFDAAQFGEIPLSTTVRKALKLTE